ncbi:hypothetical protein NST47_22240 [Paenibacillus sp. FSL H8-0034]|uniref:hypothetical protein n=1 Tax=Paenibacillus sp. FSL H8-0034 TaxID=2954671 RepID=UPI0030FBC109
MFPVQDFEFVALTIAENEQARGERIQPEPFLNESGEAVDRFTQIRAAASQIDLPGCSFV